MKENCKLKRLDIFKCRVSLPGLVLKFPMKETDSKFVFYEEDKSSNAIEDRQRETLFYYQNIRLLVVYLLYLMLS